MRGRERLKLTALGTALTLTWLAAGTFWFVRWQ